MAQIKQHLSESIGLTCGIVMSCGQWRTPPPSPFARGSTHVHQRRVDALSPAIFL
jgi:hypothetical protein